MSLNIDAAVEHVKIIVDNIRCALCDKKTGSRVRYGCGHTCCDECVVIGPDCSVCLTPQQCTTLPVPDQPFTQRARNAANLMKFFENAFHIDVYKRKRISDQLKVEKELFPLCIQAPAKYINKRRSFKSSNKENRLSQLPGEVISVWDSKMDQSNSNVETWLNKYVRKPFSDLNANVTLTNNSSAIRKQQKNADTVKYLNVQTVTRKRPHIKTAMSVVNQSLVDNHLRPVNKKEYCKKLKIEKNSSVKPDTQKNIKIGSNDMGAVKIESGIFIDDEFDEAVITIDDSQSVRVDKDYNAWLAVQEAENKILRDSASVISSKCTELLEKDNESKKGDSKMYVGQTRNNKKFDEKNKSNNIHIGKSTNFNIDVGKADDIFDDIKAGNKVLYSNKDINTNIQQTTIVPFFLKGQLSERCIDCNRNELNNLDPAKIEPPKDVSVTVENKNFIATIKVTNIEKNKKLVTSKHSVEVQTDIIESMNDGKENDMNIDYHYSNKNPIACESKSQDIFKVDNLNNTENIECLETDDKTLNVIIEESDSDGDLGASLSFEVKADVHRSPEGVDYGILADVDNVPEHSKRPRRAARGYTPTSTDSSDKENYNPNRKKKASSSKKKPMKKLL